MTSQQRITLASLYRYPVKSMIGEELRSTDVTKKGLAGDRAMALLDEETGKIVSAKNPKRWPGLFSFHARSMDISHSGGVHITLPDGSTVSADHEGVDGIISDALGRKVRLLSQPLPHPQLEEYWPDIEELDKRNSVTDENMPAGTFFDLATVHILTTSTIDELRRLSPESRFEPRRFRPNLILHTETQGFTENGWIGKTLLIGKQVQFTVTALCPRCVMTTLPQSVLPQDTNILKTAVRQNNGHVGVYAKIIAGGTITCGDAVKILD